MAAETLYDRLATLADVESLIAMPLREGDTVEYKRASAALTQDQHGDVARDVSAFANSSGGTIIYGVGTDPKDKTLPVAIEPINPANIETIMKVIAARVRHPVSGIRNKTIQDASGAPVCLLLDVPASPFAPHMALGDYRYYRRNGPHNEPMGHDLVELYFRRRLGPIIRPDYKLLPTSDSHTAPSADRYFRLEMRAENVGPRIGRDLLLMLTIPHQSLGCAVRHREAEITMSTRPEGQFATLSQPYRNPLHSGLTGPPLFVEFSVDRDWIESGTPFIAAELYADEMEPVVDMLAITFDKVRRSYGLRITDVIPRNPESESRMRTD